MTKARLFRALLLIAATAPVFAQAPGVNVTPGTQISIDNAKLPHAESFLAINPKNQRNWLATSIVIEDGKGRAYPYVTFDSGKSWSRGKIRGGKDSVVEGGDPIVYFGPDGTAFFGTLQGTPIGWLLSRSTDGGATWQEPITIPGGTYDRQYMAFDSSGGKFKSRMYAGGCITVAEANGKRHNTIDIVYSEDSGKTFSSGKLLSAEHGGEEMFVMADLLVTSDGKLVIPYSTYAVKANEEYQFNKDAPVLGHMWTVISEDGGVSFLPAIKGPTRSRGKGMKSLLSDAAPRAAIDGSRGPYRDRLYLTWADFDGKKYVVKVSHSSDLGRTWSSPVVVNDNTNGGEPANPAIAVNKDGVVAVIFNDRRDDPKNACYELYTAISLDGGETFSPNLRASTKPTCPFAAGNWQLEVFSFLDVPLDRASEKRRPAIATASIPTRWPNGGDTQGLAATDDGTFRAAWINGETGVMQLWSKDIVVDKTAALQSANSESRKDLSSDLTLEVGAPDVNFETHTVSVKVRLENKLPTTFEGPFTVVLDDIDSALQGMRVVNSDNKMAQKGAAWNFDGARSLAPKEESDEREFRWEFTGGPPDEPKDVLYAHFKILGPAAPKTGGNASPNKPGGY